MNHTIQSFSSVFCGNCRSLLNTCRILKLYPFTQFTKLYVQTQCCTKYHLVLQATLYLILHLHCNRTVRDITDHTYNDHLVLFSFESCRLFNDHRSESSLEFMLVRILTGTVEHLSGWTNLCWNNNIGPCAQGHALTLYVHGRFSSALAIVTR